MRLRFVASLLCCLTLGLGGPAGADDLKIVASRLDSRLKGQVVTFRQPMGGKNLRFDREGKLLKGGPEGPWTLYARVEVDNVTAKAGVLRLDGVRLYVAFVGAERRFTHIRSRDEVRIEFETGLQDPDLARVQDVLARVFVSEEELPQSASYEQLRVYFSRTGKESTPENREESNEAVTDQPNPAHRIGGKVSAPQCMYCPDPEYPEEARRNGHQGVVVLWCIVSAAGRAESIRLQKPLGMGLDEAAVRAVKKWRFRPALRDGEPVPVYMAIEINFHLYRER